MRLRELTGYATLFTAPALAVGYAFAKAQAMPANAPTKFQHAASKTVVGCLGASMFHGTLSYDVVSALASRLGPDFQLVNAGRNGDLAWNALSRIDALIACKPDFVIVLVGSNDVMAALSPKATARYQKMKKLPERPTLIWYRDNLRAIVNRLRAETHAKVALCSLPCLGEVLDSPGNARIAQYNGVVRQVASELRTAYVPLHEAFAVALESTPPAKPRSSDGSPWPMLRAAIAHHVLGQSFDAIGEKNGYALLSDGVHFTSRAAALAVDRFEVFIRGGAG
jgi:acyl-CoA thioesterase-1